MSRFNSNKTLMLMIVIESVVPVASIVIRLLRVILARVMIVIVLGVIEVVIATNSEP